MTRPLAQDMGSITNLVLTNGDVVVEAGKTLTIRCRVMLSPGSRVIIKPTGQLILDGGTLDTYCSGMWQGVQVRGNKNAHQWITKFGKYQGVLQILNGGAIMNAQVGVTTIAKYKNDNMDWNQTGGIIQATSANFNNNNKDVEFMWY